MAHARAQIGALRYRVDLRAGHHGLIADESPALGGQDCGPAPYELLLAALGACTAITLKMYAERKAWPLEQLEVGLTYVRAGEEQRIERVLTLVGGLDQTQRDRLADIAERTPVTLTLKGGLPIHTRLA